MSTTIIEWEGKAIPADRKYGAGGNGQKYTEGQLLLCISSMTLAIRKALKRRLYGTINIRLEMEIPARIREERLVQPCMEALRKASVFTEGAEVPLPEAVRVGNAHGPSKITFIITEGP